MAQIEISVISRQCLRERMDNVRELSKKALLWQQQRNRKEVKVDWRFTTDDARIKLKKLCPSVS